MGTTPATRQEKLRVLKISFARQVPEIMARIVKGCASALDNPSDPAGLADALRQAHILAGTAGTFGWMGVSVRARDLETLLQSSHEAGRFPESASLSLLVAELGRVLNEAVAQEEKAGVS
jgi:chemotaxis protein histidine kinase CheA